MDSSRKLKVTFEDFYKLSERRKRISIDVDLHHLKADPWRILRVFYALKTMFPDAKVTVEKKKGFQIKAVGKSIQRLPIEKRVDIREMLNDDYQRIAYERLKLRCDLDYFVDSVFSAKHYPNGEWRINEEVNPIALPWVARIPAAKS